jgi:hypothetical protein
MSLKVIGAGFGRTGTMSLKIALEMLGFSPCYHMMEVFENPEHIYHWHDFVFGKSSNWESVFRNYQAAVDWPAYHFWRELAEAYPQAKVILSVRSPESWYRSATNTILNDGGPPPPDDASEQDKVFHEMVHKMIREDTFHGRFEDQAYAMQVFTDHIETVRQTIAPERLLVFQAADGWEPLCRFLAVPIPDEPYPHSNSTDEFKQKQEERRQEEAKAKGDDAGK